MASYIDAAAIVGFGTAMVIYQRAVGLSATTIGIASAALTLGIAVGALAGGVLGDRLGRRPVFSATMILIVAGAATLALSTQDGLILGGALVLGLGAGADLPVSLSTISEAATDANRGKLIGFSQVLWFVGILAAIGLGILFGNAGQLGGQIMFCHVAVTAAAVMLARLTIPESEAWLTARASSVPGVRKGHVRELLGPAHRAPFLALITFYSLTNLSANTIGQFGSFLLVNVAGLDVRAASALALPFLPLGIVGTFWFMAIADGRRRFTYFTVGAVLMVLGNVIPAVFGLTVATYIASRIVTLLGAAFAGEAIMKTWAQESFPTLLRTTAQGSVIAVARLLAALVAGFTPLLITAGTSVLFSLLSAASLLGLAAAWLVFRGREGRSEFRAEQVELSAAESVPGR
jgi:inositol transporter-like SP family MFS transporter